MFFLLFAHARFPLAQSDVLGWQRMPLNGSFLVVCEYFIKVRLFLMELNIFIGKTFYFEEWQ